MTPLASRERAEALDAADPLARFRGRFVLEEDRERQPVGGGRTVSDGEPRSGRLIYLDGNSLGRLPRATLARLSHLVGEEWGSRLIRGWEEGWMELPIRVGDLLGASVLGAAPGQLVVADSTSVCFYKLACAALSLRPGRTAIVTDVDNFPTDRYVLEGIASACGLELVWLRSDSTLGPDPESVARAVTERTALVTFSHVGYRSGSIADMAAINRIAHRCGALCLWDLSHSAGSVPVQLDDDGADFAVGCTYKYLNAGPGAPAFMYARAELQHELRQPIQGWLGRRDPFEMAPGYEPASSVTRLLSGTPSVLGLACVEEGVRLVAEAGMSAIRAKAVALTALAIEFADARLAEFGVRIGSPRDPARRGAHVALTHPDARQLCAQLIERGVIPDFRGPDVVRIGLSPLTTRFVDVWDGLEVMRELLARSGVSG